MARPPLAPYGCSHCGADIWAGQTYCSGCGQALTWDPPLAAAPRPAPVPAPPLRAFRGWPAFLVVSGLLILMAVASLVIALMIRPHAAAPSPAAVAETAYLRTVTQEAQTLRDALAQMAPEMHAGDLLSAAWQGRVSVPMAAIKATASEAETLNPPPRFTGFDETFKGAMRHYDRAMDLMAEGIDRRSQSSMEEASHELDWGNVGIEQANAQMTALTGP